MWRAALLFGLTALCLADCASVEQIAAADDATCQGYGIAPGSAGYAECRNLVEGQRRQRRAAALSGLGRALSNGTQCNSASRGEAFACGLAAGDD